MLVQQLFERFKRRKIRCWVHLKHSKKKTLKKDKKIHPLESWSPITLVEKSVSLVGSILETVQKLQSVVRRALAF